MKIRRLRILPALAIARFGSANTPIEAYTLGVESDHPLNFRHITPMRTLVVDEATGEIFKDELPSSITFKEGGRIRPVAPFLEVFAETDGDDGLVRLDKTLLEQNDATPGHISWTVSVSNRKVFRRTGDANDIVSARPIGFSDHEPHRLDGVCPNFIEGGSIDFGHVRYIKPNDRYPEIRLRFTPAKGLIYGPDKPLDDPKARKIPIPKECAIYDGTKSWLGFEAPKPEDNPFFNETLPPALFANQALRPVWLNKNIAVSRGYLDDACDGFVRVEVLLRGERFTAVTRICSAPPIVAPDVQFVRTLMDDLEQIQCGPEVRDELFAVTRDRAEHIVRRAAETVRFLNLVVMNGNTVKGLPPLSLDTMPAEEAFATQRMLRPIMAENTVDTLTVLGLHEQLLAALRGGTAPWFLRLLRRPEEVADFTDRGRRKMPAMMCGADGNYLALTYRQIHTLGVVARHQPADDALPATTPDAHRSDQAAALTPKNLTAQQQYIGIGNPISSHPMTAVGNSCPGLEVDFRAVWRRMLEGIELREYDNVVMEVTDPDPLKQALRGQRLLRVDGAQVVTQMLGPSASDPTREAVITMKDNPSGVATFEWSNTFANALWSKMGKEVRCDFTAADLTAERPIAPPQLWGDQDYPPATRLPFKVRHFFDPGTVVISRDLADNGELTQGLCSPWQNDYRECSCYYWASSRPDFVNVEPSESGFSIGDNWLQKHRTKDYVPDDYVDSRLVLYEDLFNAWETWLRFQIGGRDAETGERGSANCVNPPASSENG